MIDGPSRINLYSQTYRTNIITPTIVNLRLSFPLHSSDAIMLLIFHHVTYNHHLIIVLYIHYISNIMYTGYVIYDLHNHTPYRRKFSSVLRKLLEKSERCMYHLKPISFRYHTKEYQCQSSLINKYYCKIKSFLSPLKI